jgi:hypothetical protein
MPTSHVSPIAPSTIFYTRNITWFFLLHRAILPERLCRQLCPVVFFRLPSHSWSCEVRFNQQLGSRSINHAYWNKRTT